MSFVREIPESKLTDEVLAPYQTSDYEIRFEDASVTIWAII